MLFEKRAFSIHTITFLNNNSIVHIPVRSLLFLRLFLATNVMPLYTFNELSQHKNATLSVNLPYL